MEHENLNTEETANSDLGAVSGSWIDENIKPTTSDCVAVMVDNFKYPTIGWYNKKFGEWVLEDRDVKGRVLRWFPLPNYR